MTGLFSYGPLFRWFAWHPVWTRDRGTRWLRMVYRQRVYLNEKSPACADAGWDHYVEDPRP